ncbi:MAG: hypothetical protein ACN4EP_05165, partial [Sediminibacterium sp.]
VKEVKMFIKAGSFSFTIPQSKTVKDDSILYLLEFEGSGDETKLKKYGLTLQSIKIPRDIINSIDTAKLEKRLLKADKFYNDYYSKDKPVSKEETAIIESANRDILQLFEKGGNARGIAKLLMLKYWPEDNYKQSIPDLDRLKENYQVEMSAEWSYGKIPTADELYNKAKENFHVPKIKDMMEEHVISDALFEQAQFEISFGREWIAYNTIPYFLDKGDVHFFSKNDEAHEFSCNNISEYDNYQVIRATSIQDFLLQIPYGRFEGNRLDNLLNKNLSIMNEKNYDFLKDQLKNTGFGEDLQKELKEKMEKQTPEFQLNLSKQYGKDEMKATLHFKKSDESEMYFFNKYDAAMKPGNNGDELKQTFYINKGNTITLKEAYNLMSGRAVNKDLTTKEGEKYNAWVQMNFKETDTNGNYKMNQYHQNYGFNLEQALAKLPIKELANDADKKALVQSLEKGNRQAVTFVQEGKEQRHFIEANPQYKNINIYDGNMQRVNLQAQKEKESESQSTKQETKKGVKAGDDDGEAAPANGQKSKKKRGVSI